MKNNTNLNNTVGNNVLLRIDNNDAADEPLSSFKLSGMLQMQGHCVTAISYREYLNDDNDAADEPLSSFKLSGMLQMQGIEERRLRRTVWYAARRIDDNDAADEPLSLSLNNKGQAMVEYAIITALILGGLTMMSYSVLPEFVQALQNYLDGFYFILNLPVP